MANTSNIGAGKPAVAGGIYVGATTATLPTSPSATLTGFDTLGYISEDGVTNNNTPDTEDVKAWGGATVMSIQTGKEDTFTFTLLEVLNEDVLKLVYGDANVTTATSVTTVKATMDDYKAHAFVIDMLINGKKQRMVIPNGKVSDLGEITYNDSEAVGYEVTITAMPDPAVTSQDVTHYIYIG